MVTRKCSGSPTFHTSAHAELHGIVCFNQHKRRLNNLWIYKMIVWCKVVATWFILLITKIDYSKLISTSVLKLKLPFEPTLWSEEDACVYKCTKLEEEKSNLMLRYKMYGIKYNKVMVEILKVLFILMSLMGKWWLLYQFMMIGRNFLMGVADIFIARESFRIPYLTDFISSFTM